MVVKEAGCSYILNYIARKVPKMIKVFIVGLFVILPMVIAYPEEVLKWKTIEHKKPPLNCK